MLTFVGLGLYDPEDITLKGLEAIREADVVYAEFYTSPAGARTIEKLEEAYGRRISLLAREELEEGAERGILELAKSKKVVLLSGGDAMIATTHVDLRLRAIERGIETRIVHAASIASAAAGLCGLQNYKFGSPQRYHHHIRVLYPMCPMRRWRITESEDSIHSYILISECA